MDADRAATMRCIAHLLSVGAALARQLGAKRDDERCHSRPEGGVGNQDEERHEAEPEVGPIDQSPEDEPSDEHADQGCDDDPLVMTMARKPVESVAGRGQDDDTADEPQSRPDPSEEEGQGVLELRPVETEGPGHPGRHARREDRDDQNQVGDQADDERTDEDVCSLEHENIGNSGRRGGGGSGHDVLVSPSRGIGCAGSRMLNAFTAASSLRGWLGAARQFV